MKTEDTQQLLETIRSWGADAVGVAASQNLENLPTDPPDLLTTYSRLISIAVALPPAVFGMISSQPTPLYASVYQTVNRMLDDLAFKTAHYLHQKGHKSLPIPASQVLDRKRWQGAISHKAVSIAAGLGWQGKNLLVITPRFGSRIRLVTVLTDAPLVMDHPIRNRCGSCKACQKACPADAIKGVGTETHYNSRNEALYFSRCVTLLTENFASLPNIGAPVCGICINACPFSKTVKYRLRKP